MIEISDASETYQSTSNFRIAVMAFGNQQRVERLQQAWVGNKTGDVIWKAVPYFYIQTPDELNS